MQKLKRNKLIQNSQNIVLWYIVQRFQRIALELLKNCLEIFPEFSQNFPRIVSEIVLEFSNCLWIVDNCQGISRKCSEIIQKFSRNCPGIVQKLSRTCPKIVQKLSKNCPKIVQTLFKIRFSICLGRQSILKSSKNWLKLFSTYKVFLLIQTAEIEFPYSFAIMRWRRHIFLLTMIN